MNKIIRFSLVLLSLFVLASGCSKKSTSTKTGLILTPKDVLAKINTAKSSLIGGSKLPASVDLSSKLPPPGNQGAQNSCVGWSIAYGMKTYQEKTARNWDLVEGGSLKKEHVFSPAYIYNQINKGEDNGAMFADAFNLLKTKGVATLSTEPYDESDYLSKPNEEANKEAKNYKIAWAKTIDPADLKGIKSYLSKGYPVIIAVSFDENFTDTKGPVVVSSMVTDENSMGHAMLVVGYDDGKNSFRIMNSWGKEWRDGGYCWFTYDVFKKIVREAWIAKDVEGDKEIKKENEQEITSENPVVDEILTELNISKVDYNAKNPDDPNAGNCLKINCSVKLDNNFGNTAQIIAFISQKDGKPVMSNDDYYAYEDGQAAGFTSVVDISSYNEEVRNFSIYIPYSVLNLDKTKTSSLIATPVLFIDDFDATDGKAVPFEVSWN